MTESVVFTVLAGTERMDRFLADQLGLSRTVAARLIADQGRPDRVLEAWNGVLNAVSRGPAQH